MLPSVARKLSLPAFVALTAIGLFSRPGSAAATPIESPLQLGDRVAQLAEQNVGAPYLWGGVSPAGFDCTGFVLWTFNELDIPLPRTEAGQLATGERIEAQSLQPGDIVVFANTYRAGLSHTGIYVGNGQFIHAANEQTGVITSSLWDSYWGAHFVGASRPETSVGG